MWPRITRGAGALVGFLLLCLRIVQETPSRAAQRALPPPTPARFLCRCAQVTGPTTSPPPTRVFVFTPSARGTLDYLNGCGPLRSQNHGVTQLEGTPRELTSFSKLDEHILRAKH